MSFVLWFLFIDRRRKTVLLLSCKRRKRPCCSHRRWPTHFERRYRHCNYSATNARNELPNFKRLVIICVSYSFCPFIMCLCVMLLFLLMCLCVGEGTVGGGCHTHSVAVRLYNRQRIAVAEAGDSAANANRAVLYLDGFRLFALSSCSADRLHCCVC